MLFLTFVLHERDHRRSALAEWVAAHQATLTALTGWTITPADVTDDRLGHLLEVLGQDASQITAVQQAIGRHSVRVYALPTHVARVDTTSFNVTHALADALAGWRISVTNSTPEDVSLVQATALYREEWTVEHGFHRWKGGQVPALPLFLHIEWRIRGLMLWLLIALQVRTLLEWQARRTLAAEQATVAGLVPGNPKMATAHPTAERLLVMFTSLHLLLH